MRSHATSIVLFVLAVALGVWVWRDRDRVSEGERRDREKNVFVAWRRDDVSRLEIAHDGEAIVLERATSGDREWRMKSPREERVDPAAADRLLGTLEYATIVRRAADGSEPAASAHVLGLDAPRATGLVRMGALAFRFALGAPSPRPEGSSYFRVDERPPFVVSKELTDALLARSETYRDRTVVPYLPADLARFEVARPGGGFAVDRKDARSFTVQGLGVLASRVALEKTWAALAELRAESFPSEADADRLTAHPRLTIRMTPSDAGTPSAVLVVGDACPDHPSDVVVLRTAPTRLSACAPRGAMDALEGIEPGELVDRRPFSLRHDEIEELRLEDVAPSPQRARRALELARRGTGFHQREPVDRELSEAEAEAASELLARIAESIAESVEAGGGPFTAVARAHVRSGEHEEIVEVGPLLPGESTVALRRASDGAHLVVSRAVARRLLPRETSTRPRRLLDEERRPTRVVLRCGVDQELVDRGGGLELVTPEGYATDASITQLVDAVTRGNVLSWVADADDGSFGLTPEGCHVALGFAGGDAPVTVRLGAEGEGGVYGAIDGRPEVFVGSRALRELARRIYVSHAALRVAPDDVESVKVVAQGRPVVTGDPERLREAAGRLFAERAVSLGAPDVGKVDVELVITVAEGGAPRRIACGPSTASATGTWRRCATADVRATFEVRAGLVDAFVRPPADAGTPRSRDAGVAR